MARNNGVKKIPLEMKRELDGLLEEGKTTLDDVRAFIASRREPGGAALPKAPALGAADYRETVRALRESREIVKDIAGALGGENGEGECTRVIMEMLRSFVFKSLQAVMRDVDSTFDAADLAKITRSLKDMIQLAQLEQVQTRRIREEEQARAAEEWRGRVNSLGTAGELKKLSDDELERKINELAGRAFAPGSD